LVSREFENETTKSVYLILDVGASMRAGTIGSTALDRGVERVVDITQTVLKSGGRVGLCTFDHKVLGFTRAGNTAKTAHDIRAHLFELQSIVHEEFTDISRDQLYERVGQYMVIQQGIPARMPELPLERLMNTGWDEDLICSHAGELVERNAGRLSALRRNFGNAADAGDESLLRLFCRLHGIPLPYRSSALDSLSTEGLTRAVSKCIEDRRTRHSVILISNLHAEFAEDGIAQIIRLVQLHKHKLEVLPLHHQGEKGLAGDHIEEALAYAFTKEKEQRQRDILQAFRRMGIMSTGRR
jgi:hypothetical protein